MIHDFTPLSALAGGAIIGLSASLFLLVEGRVAGISGLYAAVFRARGDERGVPLAFIAGLVVVGLVLRAVVPDVVTSAGIATLPLALAAGLIVGVGTQLGSGCTSGHGVCGISRFSLRSIVATCTFVATGMATVFVARHVLGGAS